MRGRPGQKSGIFFLPAHRMIGKEKKGGTAMGDRGDIDELIFGEEEYAVSQR